MHFIGPFSWKYINAKHVLVQFEVIEDYASLLSGPKGMAVWHVERHPMRVFKWSPEFDPFFEMPIVAVWCNLIALPIHLFDTPALFAIRKLFGEPIQIDQATAARTRYSFARICIEIDISKPSPEEFLLVVDEREIVEKIKWDKIPLYCSDCRHVGHSTDFCYAFGKRKRPDKKDFINDSKQSTSQGKERSGPKQTQAHCCRAAERMGNQAE